MQIHKNKIIRKNIYNTFLLFYFMSSINLSNTDNAFSSTNIVSSYSPNDLYYVSMPKIFGKDNPIVDYSKCDSIVVNDSSCNDMTSSYFNDNSQQCVTNKLCLNKKYAEEIKEIQNRHNGADEKYEDINSVYGFSIINVINLGTGILFLIFLINRYSKINA